MFGRILDNQWCILHRLNATGLIDIPFHFFSLHPFFDMATEGQVISEALRKATLAEEKMDTIHERIKLLTMEKRIDIAMTLKPVLPSGTKINHVLEKFLVQSEPHASGLRSGSIRRLTGKEHRVLSPGEDMPFEVFLEEAREGGSSTLRKVLHGNDILALKTFHTNVDEESFKKEFSILQQLNHAHVCSAVASLKDQAQKFHILLKPWCEVWSLSQVVSEFSVIPSHVYRKLECPSLTFY
jgi:hypothetical protein